LRTKVIATLVLASAAFVAVGATTAPPNLGKAIEAQRMLAKERPQDPQVLNDLGNLLVLAGDLDEARASYESAIEIDASLASAHYNLGLLLQQQGERRRALAEFKKVLKTQPANAWAHFQSAVLHEAAGSDSEAIEHYAAAFRLNPHLSFSEVNPQIIDSKLVTQALLRAHRDGSVDSVAPRDYEQASRIVKLMVNPTAPAAEVAPADATPAAEPAPPGRAPRAEAGATPSAAQPAPAAPGSRTLRAEDLEPERGATGSTGAGSVRRGGSRVSTPPPSGPTGNFTRPRIAPGVQPGPPPEPPRYTPPPAVQDDEGDDGYDVEGDSIQGIAPSGGERLRFIPGIQSSGRLEMKLVPDPPAQGDAHGRGAP
jgi:hypothetical protein